MQRESAVSGESTWSVLRRLRGGFYRPYETLRLLVTVLMLETMSGLVFQAQQAAEKAVKALLYALGVHAWGHSIIELLDYAGKYVEVGEELFTYARELDRHYIPSWYPNAFESGYPGMYYDEATASRALNAAQAILEWARRHLKRLGINV